MGSNEQVNKNTTPQETLISILPKGWRREEIIRKSGISAGKTDVTYYSTDGKKFKTKLEMQQFLGDKYDLSLFDYKTGKQSTVVLRKQKRLRNPVYLTKNIKYDPALNLPIRQTASIFKQPVTLITNHKNEPSKVENQVVNKNNDKPRPVQLFWELRFNDLKAIDPFTCKYNIDQNFELKNINSFNNLQLKTDSLLRSVAASLYLNPNKIIVGQDKEFSKNPRVFIDSDQPLIATTLISEEDVKKQETRVKDIRKNLETLIKEYNDLRVCKSSEKKLMEISNSLENV